MIQELNTLIDNSPDPRTTALRMERVLGDEKLSKMLAQLPNGLQRDFVDIISISKFLYHFLLRDPEALHHIGTHYDPASESPAHVTSLDELRSYKYRQLLKITWMDIAGVCAYPEILTVLSHLAISIIGRSIQLSTDAASCETVLDSMCVIALGKLGANELNYSSDIDLIFVSENPDDSIEAYQLLQEQMFTLIRKMNSNLEQRTPEGFLYRVDLKLRPWGSSGPLVMSVDDTEHYYAASSESWERFAWLRARPIAGSERLAADLFERLRPFIFMRSLSSDDLVRFVEIKDSMSKARKRRGHWNVKVGQGGIRDIEFFIQILQIVNAAHNPVLQTTNTLAALEGLKTTGLITPEEEREIYRSYIFLRQLENRLQMFEEKQTHDLPADHDKRLILARSLLRSGENDHSVLDSFENELIANQTIAAKYFDRVLPDKD